MPARQSLIDLSIENARYAGGRAYIYRVDASLQRTTTLAALYDAPTGTTELANPVALDSRGKAPQPVYVGEHVYILWNLEDGTQHETGILLLTGRWMGDWASDVAYQVGDWVRDGPAGASTSSIYVCVEAHASGTWATDLGAQKWELMIDVAAATATANASAAAAAASATTAGSAATAAAASATAAATSAAGINMPSIGGHATHMLRAKADETGLEYRTPGQVLSDIGGEPVDGDILRADVSDTLTAGYNISAENLGAALNGTLALNLAQPNIHFGTVTGNVTIDRSANVSDFTVHDIILTMGAPNLTVNVSGNCTLMAGEVNSTNGAINVVSYQHRGTSLAALITILPQGG